MTIPTARMQEMTGLPRVGYLPCAEMRWRIASPVRYCDKAELGAEASSALVAAVEHAAGSGAPEPFARARSVPKTGRLGVTHRSGSRLAVTSAYPKSRPLSRLKEGPMTALSERHCVLYLIVNVPQE